MLGGPARRGGAVPSRAEPLASGHRAQVTGVAGDRAGSCCPLGGGVGRHGADPPVPPGCLAALPACPPLSLPQGKQQLGVSGSFPPGQELFLSPTEERGAGKELSRQVSQGMVSLVPGEEAALSQLFAQDPEQIVSELRLWRLSRPCRSKTYRRRSAGQNKSARAAVVSCRAQLKKCRR